MTLPIITITCIILLIAYVSDIFALKKNVPSVILLLALGIIAQEIVTLAGINIPDLHALLPVLGTVGLILIVLDGALELKVTRSRAGMIRKAIYMALIPILLIAFLIAYVFYLQDFGSFKQCLANAIPLSIISSAVAIPSVKNLDTSKKEFVVYESSLSDILGVLFFNFVALNHEINIESVEHFGLQIVLILIVTIMGTLGIAWLINRINHQVKHTPVLLIIILIYAISKMVHLPGLVFVLICGLFLGNVTRFAHFKLVKKLNPEKLAVKIESFRELSVEATFIIRVLFFILFGFLININDILNMTTLPWAAGIVTVIYFIRAVFLLLLKAPVLPLLFVAPRGLITILLFYSLLPADKIPMVNISLIIQIVLLTVLVMMAGLLLTSKKTNEIIQVG